MSSGALWLQFAESIGSDKQYRQCETVRNTWSCRQNVNRADQRYCSDACRARHSAVGKNSHNRCGIGKTLREIAKATGSDMQTIKQWLKPKGKNVREKKTRRRRGYGEGSIHQRPDGTWRATISAGYDANGKRKRRDVYGKTKKEVQDELAKLQNAKAPRHAHQAEPHHGSSVPTTVARRRGPRDRPGDDVPQLQGDRQKPYIDQHIGGVGLQKLSPAHVQAMYSQWKRRSQPAVRQLTHAVLHRALKQASSGAGRAKRL